MRADRRDIDEALQYRYHPQLTPPELASMAGEEFHLISAADRDLLRGMSLHLRKTFHGDFSDLWELPADFFMDTLHHFLR